MTHYGSHLIAVSFIFIFRPRPIPTPLSESPPPPPQNCILKLKSVAKLKILFSSLKKSKKNQVTLHKKMTKSE